MGRAFTNRIELQCQSKKNIKKLASNEVMISYSNKLLKFDLGPF
jgi:hypothetical protein